MIHCENCGCELPDGTLFCGSCGAKQGVKKSKKKIILITSLSVVAALVLASVCGVFYFLQPNKQYEIAERAFASQNYGRAMRCYKRAGNYGDAPEKLAVASQIYYYTSGLEALEKGNYDEAVEDFKLSEGYEDTAEQLKVASYYLGKEQYEDGKYEDAIATLADISKYEDTADILKQCHYYYGKELYDAGDTTNAGIHFSQSGDFEDSHDIAMEIADGLVEAADYKNAGTIYEGIGEKSYQAYCDGMIAVADKDYLKAKNKLKNAKNVFDGAEQFNEADYQYGLEQFNAKNYHEARAAFGNINGYKDADDYYNYAGLLYAATEISDGNLNSALKYLSSLPADCSYEGVSVQDLQGKLDANSSWVSLCGKWVVTSGQMRTTLDASYTDYWWYVDFDEGSYPIDVHCGLNDDGSVKVSITGSIPIYTNYSSWREYLEYGDYKINVNQDISSMGTIKLDDYASITLSDSKITFSYKKNENNNNVYSDYVYKTDATYGKRATEY